MLRRVMRSVRRAAAGRACEPVFRKDRQSLPRLAGPAPQWPSFATTSTAETAATGFAELGVSSELCAALDEAGIATPTPVQSVAIPHLLSSREHCFFAAQTGTGKTLAYLLPVVQALRRDELEQGVTARLQRPRALVVVPSRELAVQVLGVAKTLSHHARFKSVLLTGGSKRSAQKSALRSFVDLAVVTPGRCNAMRRDGELFSSDVKYVVFDEADTLFNPRAGFLDEVDSLVDPIMRAHDRDAGYSARGPGDGGTGGTPAAQAPRLSPAAVDEGVWSAPQFIMAAATTSRAAERAVLERFPHVTHLAAPRVHHGPSQLDQQFMPVGAGPSGRHDALVEALYAVRSERVMVFCSTISSCRSTGHALEERGINVVCLHGGMPPKLRQQEYARFLGGECDVLVCTDAAARGLDTPGLQHVINFDFPPSETDYLHRAGRTARMGNRGVVTTLVGKKDRAAVASLRDAVQAGRPLSRVRGGSAFGQGLLAPSGSGGGKKRRPGTRSEQSARRKGRAGAVAAGGGKSAGGGAVLPRRRRTLPSRARKLDRESVRATGSQAPR